MGKKDPWTATILSAIVIGLGQIYNEDYGKGITFFVLAIVLGISVLFIGILSWIGLFIIWLWSVNDSWEYAKKINKQEKPPRKRKDSSQEIIKKRYARGEITKKQFERMRRDLE